MINFNEVFEHAEATTPFDQLIAVLNTAQKAVKAERDRIYKDETAETKFTEAVCNVSALSKQLADNPALIDDYLDAAAEMKKANTARNNRGEKSEPQWPDINQCWSRAEDLLLELSGVEQDVAIAA
jgi:hypothetical protein